MSSTISFNNIQFNFFYEKNKSTVTLMYQITLNKVYSTFSILWNGNKLSQFKPTHGLRQGDPLSPYLFILCMEKLYMAINNAVNQGNWEPLHISNARPHLFHLLFADDMVLFTKAKGSQFRFASALFDGFSKAS